jgi:hypothetical protein
MAFLTQNKANYAKNLNIFAKNWKKDGVFDSKQS